MGSIPIDHFLIFIERLSNMIQKFKNLAYQFFSNRGLQLLYFFAYLKGIVILHQLNYSLTILEGTLQKEIPEVLIYLMITAVILLIRIGLSFVEWLKGALSENHKYYTFIQYLKVTINCYLVCVFLVYGVASIVTSSVLK